MKVTVSLTDDVYRRARIEAAKRNSSVSALVREFLTRLGAENSDVERRKRLQRDVLATIHRFRGADRLTRDLVHHRRSVR